MFDKLSLDWFSFTFRVINHDDYEKIFYRICDLLHETNGIDWQEKSRLRGYAETGLILGGLGFVGYHPKRLEMGVHVSLPGSALSLLETRLSKVSTRSETLGELQDFDLLAWFDNLFETPPTAALGENYKDGEKLPFVWPTRLDWALDDLTGQLNLDQMIEMCKMAELEESNYITSRFRSFSLFQEGWGKAGKTLYLGSRESECYGRIYDKAAQQKIEDQHWIRVEFEYKGDKAKSILQQVRDLGLSVVPRSFLNYVSFKQPPETEDKNRSRWPIAEWWQSFLSVAEKITLGLGQPSSSIQKVETWIIKQVAPALALMSKAFSTERIEQYVNDGLERLNEKHYAMLKAFSEGQSVDPDLSSLLDVASELGGVVTSGGPAWFDQRTEELKKWKEEMKERRMWKKLNHALKQKSWLDEIIDNYYRMEEQGKTIKGCMWTVAGIDFEVASL